MTEVNPPSYLANGCYTAQMDRQLISALVCEPGVVDGANDLKVTAGDGMAVVVSAGTAFIEGTVTSDQGMYLVTNDGPVTLDVTGADPTDSRIDLVVARVYDSVFEGDQDRWAIEIVEGLTAPSPVEPDVPSSAIVLARVNVPAGAAEITATEITDRRSAYRSCSSGEVAQVVTFTAGSTFRKADYIGASGFRVRGVGGGGGGGSAGAGGASSGRTSVGGGGGGGGYFEKVFSYDELPESVAVSVGAGGGWAAQTDRARGETGGTTRFANCSATGGNGGMSSTNKSGDNHFANLGLGGTASGGDLNSGGSAGTNGHTSTNNAAIYPGLGGGTVLGGATGNGAGGSGARVAGLNGAKYGGGGSGAMSGASNVAAGVAGGRGASGVVIVEVLG